MKKVKIMLTAIGILAVVGGSLAFKAKKFSTISYCTQTQDGSAFCTISTPSKLPNGVGPQIKYVRVANNATCPSDLRCTSQAAGLVD